MYEIFLKLIEVGGLAFACVCVGLLALYRGDVIPRKSVDALVKAKDEAIEREKRVGNDNLTRERERSTELWTLLRPMISVAQGSLEKLESGPPAARRRTAREGG